MPVAEKELSDDITAFLRKLVHEHLRMKDEPLQLAVHFDPAHSPEGRHVHLLEIADHFGLDAIDAQRTMFEVAYGWPPGDTMDSGQQLKLLLTNPSEWKVAVKQNWPALKPLRDALRMKRTKILFHTPRGLKLWRLLRG